MSEVHITGLNKFTARLRSASKKLQDGTDDVAERSAEYGAELMREYISTRGTGYIGKGARATAEGRIDTGKMIDAVGVSPVRHNPSGVAVNFGWVNETEEYFSYQELGTRSISPMHALLDATIRTREYFYDEIKHMVREI
jgi:hypothetical protein